MRFIGSKTLLIKDIEEIINKNVHNAESFCDIFSGTAVVAKHFKKKYQIISNDLLHFSFVIQKATIENQGYPKFKKLKNYLNNDPMKYLNEKNISITDLKHTPFIYENYSPASKKDRKYFTKENALKIDYVRQTIEEWKKEKLITDNEYYYLLAGLIEGVPYISNIAGTYGAYLKHWDKRSYKNIEIIKSEAINNNKNNKCYNTDSEKLIKKISGDIIYIDPPYNARQYAPNYHLLETISRYDSPEIYGVTGMRPYKEIKSNFCLKNDVLNSFSNLIKNAKFKHIILSYSTEGIMSIKDIKDVLFKYGKQKTYYLKQIPYRRYKHTKGSIKKELCELLFYIKKEN